VRLDDVVAGMNVVTTVSTPRPRAFRSAAIATAL
jgi:hypothetical protein